MKTKFKLFVEDSKQKDRRRTSIDILMYIYNNIESINSMGVYIDIVKIHEDSIDKKLFKELQKKGITRMPALLADGKRFVGSKKIKELFNNNMSEFSEYMQAENAELSVGEYGFSGDNNLSSYWQEEMSNMSQEETEDNGINKDLAKANRETQRRQVQFSRQQEAMENNSKTDEVSTRIPSSTPMVDNIRLPPDTPKRTLNADDQNMDDAMWDKLGLSDEF